MNSAFIATTLAADLRAAGHGTLLLTGVTTDHCVSTSARMAANLGFRATIAGDACFTFDRTPPSDELVPAEVVHNVRLASLHNEFAQLRKTAEIIDGLAPAA